jgi:hypothetical protein
MEKGKKGIKHKMSSKEKAKMVYISNQKRNESLRLKLLEIFTILPFYVCVWGNPFSSSFVQ